MLCSSIFILSLFSSLECNVVEILNVLTSSFINGFGKTDMNYQSGILVFVSSADRGAGGMVLLSLCGLLIRSGLDCGCIVCGSARSSCFRLFDAVHHQGLRLSLGEFRVSPVKSLYVEASEPSLKDRRVRLSVRCATELRAYPSSLACDCVLSPLYEDVCDKQPNAVQPFGLLSGIIL